MPGASWQQGDISEEQWQPEHAAAPEVPMPSIGELVVHDFRSGAEPAVGATTGLRVVRVTAAHPPPPGPAPPPRPGLAGAGSS